MRKVKYTYDSRGKPEAISGDLATTIGALNPFRYRGYFYDEETGWYYVSSRYYDPEVGRFISPDTTDILDVQNDLYDKNLYAYCDNNPVMRVDFSGAVWDTVIDIVSFGADLVAVAEDPKDAVAWIALTADAACLVVPFATGGGLLVKAITKSDDVSGAIKTARKVDYYVTPVGDAIPATRKAFDNNLSKLELKNNKYYSNDSRGPVRIRVEKHDPTPGYKGPNNPYHCNPHFHIDRREKGSSGPFKKVFTGLMEWLR